VQRTSESDTVMHITGTNASLAPEGKFIINMLKKPVADCPVHIKVKQSRYRPGVA